MNTVQPIRDIKMIAAIKKYLEARSERDEFLFTMGINIGLRIMDYLQFRVSDVRDKEEIVIRERKTGKIKTVEINPTLQKAIKKYIAGRSDDEYLFPSRQKDKHGMTRSLSREMAYKIMRDVAEHFKLKLIGCHTMRKTYGYHLYQQEKDVALLMDIFNHSKEEITLRYIGVNQDAIKKAMRKFGL